MKKTLFTTTVLSAFLLTGIAYAQDSNTGTPNTLHGSGDMMQDGLHASSNPNADAEGNALPSGSSNATQQSRRVACEKKWEEAQKNGVAATTTRTDFVNGCINSM